MSDPREPSAIDRATLRRIVGYLVPHRREIALATFAIAVAAVLGLLPPLAIKWIVDDVIVAGDRGRLLLLCALMVAGPSVAALVSIVPRHLAARLSEDVVFALRTGLFRQLHRQPVDLLVSAQPGQAVSHVLNDVQDVGQTLRDGIVKALQNASTMVASVAAILLLDWRLAALALMLLPVFALPLGKAGRQRRALKRANQETLAQLTGILVETLSAPGAQHVRLSGTEEREFARLEAKADELRSVALRQRLVARALRAAMTFVTALGPALAYAVGGLLVIDGQMPLGTVVAFAALLGRLYSPASELATAHVDLVASYASFERIFRVLDAKPSITSPPDAPALPPVSGAIRFERVFLRYDRDDWALENVDLAIAAGECVALVGPSGAGKTSLALLVARLRDPTEGTVRVDGVDLRTVDLASLRSQVAVVAQDVHLFHASVLDNLRYGNPNATRADIESAAHDARLDTLLGALPQGCDTVVGDGGFGLSGGERQRIAIARALLKDAPILILDEATSSLDAEAEASILASVERRRRGRTTLVVSHRVSAVRHADRIVVLDRGKVVEVGDHADLVARNGAYAASLREQRSGGSPNPGSTA